MTFVTQERKTSQGNDDEDDDKMDIYSFHDPILSQSDKNKTSQYYHYFYNESKQ